SMYEQFKELADVDITAGPMEVGPTTYYVMGGIRVDAETGATTMPELFAAGEVAGGMHGANRLGGNSLSDLLVFGERTGAGAAAHAASVDGEPHVDPAQVRAAEAELEEPLARTAGTDPYRLREELQSVMQSLVGIFRTKDDLEQAIDRLDGIRDRARDLKVIGGRTFNPGWNLVFEVRNLVEISEAVARSALAREESRGAHSRLDFPDTLDDWGKVNVAVRREDGAMTVSTTPLPPMPDDLRELVAAGGGH
ncbi:MAG TPA: FAD-binding protein, partial [Candidatus Limnocylindrales bacterium]